jgi:hypothetical protein
MAASTVPSLVAAMVIGKVVELEVWKVERKVSLWALRMDVEKVDTMVA